MGRRGLAAIRTTLSIGVLSAFVACAGVAVEARADQYLDRVNGIYANVKTDKRSDVVMLPLLAKMDAPAKVIDESDDLLLISPDQGAWAEVVKWLDGPNQKALIDGLFKVTEGKDFQDSMVFAQPYGAEGVSPEMIQARMYSELGDPPLLAAVEIQYLPAMKRMHKLAQLEAIRRSSGGDVLGGLEVLARLAFFGRQMAERPMMQEVVVGYTMMWQAMERMRDIAYEDFRGNKALRQQAQLSKLPDFVNKIEDDRGVFSLDRMPFPLGNRAAADQLVSMVMNGEGAPNPGTFATTMARIGAGGRPLRLFGEAGRWDSLAKSHASGGMTSANIKLTYDDWAARWRFDPFDPRMLQPFYFANLDRGRFAVVDAVTPDMGELYLLRQFVRTQIVGTRHALAVLGFGYVNRGMWPPQLSSVRPDFIKALTADPYNPNRARGQQPPMEFFVPVRDTQGSPHTMTVFVPTGENFQAPLREDTFVLYSTGPDGGKNRAERIQNTWNLVRDTDVLMWPPVSSLWRQHLRDRGGLK